MCEGCFSTPSPEAIAASVQRGIDLLDRFAPQGWRDRINPETYNHHDILLCILGQVYGGYFRGFEILRDAMEEEDIPFVDMDGQEVESMTARAYGFDGPGEYNEHFQQEWSARLWPVAV